MFFNDFKRLQKLETFAGTFAEYYRKKYLAMLLSWNIFATENKRMLPLLHLNKEYS